MVDADVPLNFQQLLHTMLGSTDQVSLQRVSRHAHRLYFVLTYGPLRHHEHDTDLAAEGGAEAQFQ